MAGMERGDYPVYILPVKEKEGRKNKNPKKYTVRFAKGRDRLYNSKLIFYVKIKSAVRL